MQNEGLSIQKWADIVDHHRAEDSKLALVGTKCDLWDNYDPRIELISGRLDLEDVVSSKHERNTRGVLTCG